VTTGPTGLPAVAPAPGQEYTASVRERLLDVVSWGLVGEKAGYDETSRALLHFFGPEYSEEAHRLLIALGRTYCKARNPDCSRCPLRDICPYPQGCTAERS